MNIKSIVLNIEDLTENVIGMKNFAYVNCAKKYESYPRYDDKSVFGN